MVAATVGKYFVLGKNGFCLCSYQLWGQCILIWIYFYNFVICKLFLWRNSKPSIFLFLFYVPSFLMKVYYWWKKWLTLSVCICGLPTPYFITNLISSSTTCSSINAMILYLDGLFAAPRTSSPWDYQPNAVSWDFLRVKVPCRMYNGSWLIDFLILTFTWLLF